MPGPAIAYAAKEGGEMAVDAAKVPVNFARRHPIVTGALALSTLAGGVLVARGCSEQVPGLADKHDEIHIEQPQITVRKTEGVSLGCFVRQTIGIHLVGHDETNLDAKTPSVGVFGHDIIPSVTIFNNTTVADRTTTGDYTFKKLFCADNLATDVNTTWGPVEEQGLDGKPTGKYVLKTPGKTNNITKDDYVMEAQSVDVHIKGLTPEGGLTDDPSNKTHYDKAGVDNWQIGFFQHDNSNMETTLNGVAYELGMNFSCANLVNQVAQFKAEQTFDKWAMDFGHIPANKVTVHIDNLPAPTTVWGNGRLDNKAVQDQLHTGAYNDSFKFDLNGTDCADVATDTQGQLLPVDAFKPN